MRLNRCASLSALFVLLFVPENIYGAMFAGLGDLPGGGFFSNAEGISPDGSTIVGWSESGAGSVAFRWTLADGMVNLGNFIALDTSTNGSVIVGHGPGTEAIRWTSSDGVLGLGDLPGGVFGSHARGISAAGHVIAGDGRSASGNEATRWTAADGMIGLGDLPGGGFASQAFGISDDGNVIVGESDSGARSEAFRWTVGTGMVGLGDLPGGTFSSNAYDASGNGSVVVGDGHSENGQEAFRWTSGTGMIGLGDLPGGTFSSVALGVSANGNVIVGQGTVDFAGGREVFIWDSLNGMRNLKTVLTTDYGLDLTGWTLIEAKAISSDGSRIAGYGKNPDGLNEAWIAEIDVLAEVPEPGSILAMFSLATFGAGTVIIRRCRAKPSR